MSLNIIHNIRRNGNFQIKTLNATKKKENLNLFNECDINDFIKFINIYIFIIMLHFN